MKGLFVAILLAAWVSAANPNDPGQGRATLEPVHVAEVRPPSGNADFIKGRFQKRYPNSAFIEAELEKHGIVHLHDDEKKFPRVEDYAGMDLSFEKISEAPALPGALPAETEPAAAALPDAAPTPALPAVEPAAPPKPALPSAKPVEEARLRPPATPKPPAPVSVAPPAKPAPPAAKPGLPQAGRIQTARLKPAAGVSTTIQELVEHYSRYYKVRTELVYGVIRQESAFNPKAKSHCGASGLMQLMPGTAAEVGVTDIFDPSQNIAGGVQYLSKMLKLGYVAGNERLALAAYNAGPGNVRKYKGIPPFKETQDYVVKVLKYAEQYRTRPPERIVLTKIRPSGRGVTASTPVFTLLFKNGLRQPAEVVVQEGDWYYIQAGNTEGRVRRKDIERIEAPA